MSQLVYSALLEHTDDLRIRPSLALRLDNPDPLTYIAYLRHGVTFHDGHELTARDVIYTFKSIFDPALPSPFRGAFRALADVTALEVAVALLLIPLGKGIGNRAMSRGTSWLRAIGRWSYEIYLFHMLPILGLMLWFKQGERSGIATIAMYAIMLLTSIALGFLISRYFSEPLNKYLRGRSYGSLRPSVVRSRS